MRNPEIARERNELGEKGKALTQCGKQKNKTELPATRGYSYDRCPFPHNSDYFLKQSTSQAGK